MNDEIFEKYPTYVGLKKYNFGLKQQAEKVDMTLLQESLYQYLLKQDNVNSNFGQEISSMS